MRPATPASSTRPRAVVRFMVAVIDPRLGETVLDPACGTGGFLVEAFNHLEKQVQDGRATARSSRTQSIFGGEPKSLPYLLCQMNLLLHGLERRRSIRGNSLRFKLTEIGDTRPRRRDPHQPALRRRGGDGHPGQLPRGQADRRDGLLFLQLIMRKLAPRPALGKPGRAAVVVPNGTLFGDGVCARIKEELLKEFNLHTIVRLPNGVFAPYTSIPTNLLFFDRSGPTRGGLVLRAAAARRPKELHQDPADPVRGVRRLPRVVEQARGKRARLESACRRTARQRLQPRPQEPNAATDFEHLPPEQLVDDILEEGAAHRGDHAGDQRHCWRATS